MLKLETPMDRTFPSDDSDMGESPDSHWNTNLSQATSPSRDRSRQMWDSVPVEEFGLRYVL